MITTMFGGVFAAKAGGEFGVSCATLDEANICKSDVNPKMPIANIFERTALLQFEEGVVFF